MAAGSSIDAYKRPQIDTKSVELVGAEALLRWRRDNRDFRSPVEFIPVTEEYGLIVRIGEWALREGHFYSSAVSAETFEGFLARGKKFSDAIAVRH